MAIGKLRTTPFVSAIRTMQRAKRPPSTIRTNEGLTLATTGYLISQNTPNWQHSGVTIGFEIDLGHQNAKSLTALGLSSSGLATVTPYLGLTGSNAYTYVAAHGLPTISSPDATTISNNAIPAYETMAGLQMDKLANLNIFLLPADTQTALTDVMERASRRSFLRSMAVVGATVTLGPLWGRGETSQAQSSSTLASPPTSMNSLTDPSVSWANDGTRNALLPLLKKFFGDSTGRFVPQVGGEGTPVVLQADGQYLVWDQFETLFTGVPLANVTLTNGYRMLIAGMFRDTGTQAIVITNGDSADIVETALVHPDCPKGGVDFTVDGKIHHGDCESDNALTIFRHGTDKPDQQLTSEIRSWVVKDMKKRVPTVPIRVKVRWRSLP